MSRPTFTLTRRAALATALAAPALLRGFAAPAHAEAPALGASEPEFVRFRLGEFEITAFNDAAPMIDGPWPIVGEDRPAEEVAALMRARLLPEKRFRPGFTPLLVNTGRQLLLIDAGNGAEGFVPRPVGGRLARLLEPAGVTPQQIDVVAVTHCHIDHVGGLAEEGRPLFPNAAYVIGETEHAFWSRREPLAAPADSVVRKSALLFRKIVAPLRDRTTLVRPGQEIVPGVTALAAFGHTPGHLAFHVESAGRRLLIWGDCAHHEVASLAHPQWSALFDQDKEQGKATRARIYDMAATERLAVASYHASFPSVGFVERAGEAYRWLPMTYQFAE